MPKRSGAAFHRLKKQFATTRNKLRARFRATGSKSLAKKLEKDFKALSAAHVRLGFGALINFQGPPTKLARKAGRKK
jgi:hypothetical protein